MFRNFRPLVQVLALALGLSALSAPVVADPFVACVQRQLAELGYAPGPADGVMGRRTRSAWRVMKDAHEGSFSGYLKELPELSRETAIHWCRELPAIRAELAAKRPSSGEVKLRANSERAEIEVRQAYDSVRKFLLQEFGLVLAGNIGIAAADDWKVLQGLARRVKADISAGGSSPDAKIRTRCGNGDAYSAAAYQDWIFICWSRPKGAERDLLDSDRNWLWAVVAHEYVHIAQAELSGARSVLKGPDAKRRLMGPLWMIEGTAQVLEAHYSETVLRVRRPFLSYLGIRARKSERDLRELRRSDRSMPQEEYDLSHFAVRILAEARGNGTLFNFWRNLGNGLPWEQAFFESFGVELGDYEAKVMELLKRPGDAQHLLEADDFAEALNNIRVPVKIIPALPPKSFSQTLNIPLPVLPGALPSRHSKSYPKGLDENRKPPWQSP
ncbi:peptidoglycan-binding domain-containing protein [Leisingera sp. McT4-56]|uniref:peptidoglycan-binding domain-containing protein n=1 Tax=Leisingera sp. McT4-56 TaxID=2881255 RepID=UPI001CF9083B|nr:peptidoglycan-binding domain-containing protein [Leisingera sp. McT4-56]MCB4458370.1 peptidoglycan-binding protein [Leisingera sp. McT4-56]